MKPRHLFVGLLAVAVAAALVQAFRLRWVCDDAFISFRYARNLLDGLGLVWNTGERVEGYTNFLWTLWCAAGMRLGARPEIWSVASGIALHVGSVVLLGCHALLLRRSLGTRGLSVPLAALLTAAHTDWSVFATSGLEMSAFVFFVLGGTLILESAVLGGRARPLPAAILFLLATLTRPDGILFAIAAGAAFLAFTKPGLRNAAVFSIAFAVPFATFVAWRLSYYGDLFPNTYYAKSAALAWWSQGWDYLALYFRKYGVLLVSFPLAFAAARRLRPIEGGAGEPGAVRRLLLIEAVFALVHGLYVTRVGGDFMFARMLIPSTCFLALLAESSFAVLFSFSPVRQALAGVALLVALVAPPSPLEGAEQRHGITDERAVYGARLMDEYGTPAAGLLRDYLGGTDARVASLGGQAHLMYRAGIPVAIESATGLTDRVIARQPLSARGRIGHEKRASLDYLIGVRKTHFVFHPGADDILGLADRIPLVAIDLGGLRGRILHWDPELMEVLRAKGARFPDVPSEIEALGARLGAKPDEEVASLYARLKLFYFDHVQDPEREAPFLARSAGNRKRGRPSSESNAGEPLATRHP